MPTPEEMRAAVTAGLVTKTGKDLAQWAEVVRAQGAMRFMERVQWLKREHGLGHVQAQLVAWEADKAPDAAEPAPEELVAAQYAGPKAGLRVVYDRLVAAARALGEDVRIEPRQTYVSLARGRQFGVIQPSTRTRVDLGLRLDGIAETGRLQAAGSFGSGNTTHRIALGSADDVDDEVLQWMRRAYEASR